MTSAERLTFPREDSAFAALVEPYRGELQVHGYRMLGSRFFGEGTIPIGLKLTGTKAFKTGVTITTYERAGDVNPGSFEFDEPTRAELERRERLAAR